MALLNILKWLMMLTSVAVILTSISIFTIDMVHKPQEINVNNSNKTNNNNYTVTNPSPPEEITFEHQYLNTHLLLMAFMAGSGIPAIYYHFNSRLIFIVVTILMSFGLLIGRFMYSPIYRAKMLTPVIANIMFGIGMIYVGVYVQQFSLLQMVTDTPPKNVKKADNNNLSIDTSSSSAVSSSAVSPAPVDNVPPGSGSALSSTTDDDKERRKPKGDRSRSMRKKERSRSRSRSRRNASPASSNRKRSRSRSRSRSRR